jgi:hypothetical protein
MNLLDEDGYPTEEALKLVEEYDIFNDIKGFLELIKELWSYPDRFVLKGKKVLHLYLSTGGWSGNEVVIHAMKKNFFWILYWEKSVRGGHYWFKIKEYHKKIKVSRRTLTNDS